MAAALTAPRPHRRHTFGVNIPYATRARFGWSANQENDCLSNDYGDRAGPRRRARRRPALGEVIAQNLPAPPDLRRVRLMGAAPTVSEPMSWSEIRERFPDQWIALVRLDWADEHDEPFCTALVAGHGSQREAMDQARPLLKLFPKLGPFFTRDPAPAMPELPIVYVT